MARDRESCGPFYRRVREAITGDDPARNRDFAAGFVAGQAEKVYLGACLAAMFRPGSPEGMELLREVADRICAQYGLVHVRVMAELWICRPESRTEVETLVGVEPNSSLWHCRRARLCGVPSEEVDLQFHLRKGATENVDGSLQARRRED